MEEAGDKEKLRQAFARAVPMGRLGQPEDLPIQQRLRDVLGLQIGDGTAHIMKNIITKDRLKQLTAG